MQGLQRAPYQAPQTTMEYHVAELVAHLSNGIDSREGFVQKIEATQAHAFALEVRCLELYQELVDIQRELALGLPITMAWTDNSVPMHAYVTQHIIEWVIQPIRYRLLLRSEQASATDKNWARIRKWTFRQLVKELRKQYEQNVPLRLKEKVEL